MSICPISVHHFDNGLSLECLDGSKKIAADRWYVCVWFRMNIPVEERWFDNHPLDADKFQQIRRLLGEMVIFEQKKERNFIDDDQKDQIVKEICDSAMETVLKYLGHDDFAAKYILKRFADQQRTY